MTNDLKKAKLEVKEDIAACCILQYKVKILRKVWF